MKNESEILGLESLERFLSRMTPTLSRWPRQIECLSVANLNWLGRDKGATQQVEPIESLTSLSLARQQFQWQQRNLDRSFFSIVQKSLILKQKRDANRNPAVLYQCRPKKIKSLGWLSLVRVFFIKRPLKTFNKYDDIYTATRPLGSNLQKENICSIIS